MCYSHCELQKCQVGGVVTRLPAEQFYACSIQAPGLSLLKKNRIVSVRGKMQILHEKCHKKR